MDRRRRWNEASLGYVPLSADEVLRRPEFSSCDVPTARLRKGLQQHPMQLEDEPVGDRQFIEALDTVPQGLNIVEDFSRVGRATGVFGTSLQQEELGQGGECALDVGRRDGFASLKRANEKVRIVQVRSNSTQFAQLLICVRQDLLSLPQVEGGRKRGRDKGLLAAHSRDKRSRGRVQELTWIHGNIPWVHLVPLN
jgi:hypothetical protein